MDNQTKKDIIFYCLHTLVPLLLGLALYLYFRPDTYISKAIYSTIGIVPHETITDAVLPDRVLLFIRNFSCDMLWAYALTFTVSAIWGSTTRSLFPVFLICVIFELGIEFSQKVGIISGTFDVYDIFLELITTAFAALLIKKHITTKETENEKRY